MAFLVDNSYLPRLVDSKIERYLRIFGALSIEGPKWCGKTWTGKNHANSVTYLTEKSQRDMAEINPQYIFTGEHPQLIDEWQIVPEIWDAVRHECDKDKNKGKFILTGSTSLDKNEDIAKRVFHSGTGRIATLQMEPMSLFESNESDGFASISKMLDRQQETGHTSKVELDELARKIVRGGWPENLNVSDRDIGVIPASYIESIVEKDMHENSTSRRDANKMRMLIRSLSRNVATVVGEATLVRDIAENENESQLIESRQTLSEYMKVLDSLFMTSKQNAYSLNYRSSKRIGKSQKRHLVDPSLACAALHLTVDKLLADHNTFGLLFESLVERDLRIYAEHLDGKLYHFRDNQSGDEIDAIIEFEDGEYAAFEIKLSDRGIEEAKQSLKKFYLNVKKKPKMMCVVAGYCQAVMYDEENDIYIVPFTSLGP